MLATPPDLATERSAVVPRMTIERFQGIVLKLGNQMFVRHYHWLNYPNKPQIFGIQFPSGAERSAGRKHRRPRTCECGTCVKCKHRDYMKNTRVPLVDGMGRIVEELTALGFQWNVALKVWTIERGERPESAPLPPEAVSPNKKEN